MEQANVRSGNSRGGVGPGSRFGMLTVESDTGKRKNRYTIWRCRCDCGNYIDLDVRTLKRGTVRDCGCVTRVKPGCLDITGQRFGMLTAQYPITDEPSDQGAVWHCICDCGGEVNAPLGQLRSGYRKSCGCLSHPPLKDFIGKRFGKLTVTAYAGKRGGMHRWECQCDCGKKTVVGQTLLQSGKTKSCGCIQANVYKDNLKLVEGTSVTILESVRAHPYSTNTSGYTGVYPTQQGKWCAKIGFRGTTYYLGTFNKKEDAIKARRQGEELHDDFIEWYYSQYLPSRQKKITANKRIAGVE